MKPDKLSYVISQIKMPNDECVTRELIDHLTLTHSNHNRIRYIILELEELFIKIASIQL